MKSRFSSPENFHFSSLLRVPTACVEIECKNSEKEGNGVVVSRSPPVLSHEVVYLTAFSFLRIPVMTAYKSGDSMNIDLLFVSRRALASEKNNTETVEIQLRLRVPMRDEGKLDKKISTRKEKLLFERRARAFRIQQFSLSLKIESERGMKVSPIDTHSSVPFSHSRLFPSQGEKTKKENN